jgi:hypothetical protein
MIYIQYCALKKKLVGRYVNFIGKSVCEPALLCPGVLSYTVAKDNQNETLLWKIAVLGMKKPHVGAGTFCSSLMLVFYIPQCRYCQRMA